MRGSKSRDSTCPEPVPSLSQEEKIKGDKEGQSQDHVGYEIWAQRNAWGSPVPSLGLQVVAGALMASPFLPAETFLGLSPGGCRPACTCISMTTISRATW